MTLHADSDTLVRTSESPTRPSVTNDCDANTNDTIYGNSQFLSFVSSWLSSAACDGEGGAERSDSQCLSLLEL
jgi:hypothetical protein